MILTTTNSTAIHAIGYDFQKREMEVIFTGGGIYRYADVPPELYRRFLRARSKGAFFIQHVRGRFSSHRLGRFRRRNRSERDNVA